MSKHDTVYPRAIEEFEVDESIVFRYSGRVRSELYRYVINKYGNENYHIQITEIEKTSLEDYHSSTITVYRR